MVYLHPKLDQIVELSNTVLDDANVAYEIIKKDASQYNRRVLVRILFSAIEATLYGIKTYIVHFYIKYLVGITDAEITMLKEETYYLNDKGKIRTQIKYLTIEQNILFVNDIFVKYFNMETVDLDCAGWNMFKEAIQTRN